MSDVSCVIRFCDRDQTTFAYVGRDEHGHPEEVVSNIDGLQTIIVKEGKVPEPENLAAQFIAIDALLYLFPAFDPDKIAVTMWNVVTRPHNVDGAIFETLRHHTILQSDACVDVAFLYEIAVGRLNENRWLIQIAHLEESEETLGELYEDASWGFTDDLESSKEHFR